MKKYIIACICIFLFADLYPQDNFGDLKAEWQKKNFSAAQVKRLVDYHKKNPAKRTPELDYLIATSYCALKDPKGCETWFPKLLQYSSLDANTRNFIKRVQGENCPIGKSVSLVELEGAGRSRRTASVSGRLKEYSST